MLPRVQPIAPTWRKRPFDDPGWAFDVKYDGFRVLCYVERGRAYFISRNGNRSPNRSHPCSMSRMR